MTTPTQRMWKEAEQDFAPDQKIQIHSYGLEIVLVAIKSIGQLSFDLTADEARQLALALTNAADRVDANEKQHDEWVHAVNEQARIVDEKTKELADAGVHPSAWPELTKPEVDKFKRIAGSD